MIGGVTAGRQRRDPSRLVLEQCTAFLVESEPDGHRLPYADLQCRRAEDSEPTFQFRAAKQCECPDTTANGLFRTEDVQTDDTRSVRDCVVAGHTYTSKSGTPERNRGWLGQGRALGPPPHDYVRYRKDA